MCTAELSTSWAIEEKKRGRWKYGKPTSIHIDNKNNDLVEQLKQHIDTIEQYYFAGGEPLVSDEHYAILEYLAENNKTDVSIRYSTNGSKLTYKNYDICELWNKFSKVWVGLSMDSFGSRAEFMRHGTNWKEVLTNLKEIIKRCPHVNITLFCTVSVHNILTIDEFIKVLEEENILEFVSLSFPPLHDPVYYNFNILSTDLKKLAVEKLNNITVNNIKTQHEINYYSRELTKFINVESEVTPEILDMFIKETELRDLLRNENFSETFPELAQWYVQIKTIVDTFKQERYNNV
jgi:MoaA/NifB/PqqE/SkfB family radical SAM enzyme